MAKENQHPTGSGFDRGSTAADVMAGIDLSGKVAVVTGGYSGLGLETVRALEQAGADVFAPARRPDVAEQALRAAGLSAKVAAMDLADLQSVRKFASSFGDANDRLHLLINNAAIMACPETRVGPGWEAQLATNHIGHFALAAGLMPFLQRAGRARVVALSSLGHARSPIRWDDMHFNRDDYDKWTAYGQSKTANALFALALNTRFAKDGVQGFSVHPGGIMTPLQRHLQNEEMQAMGWIDQNGDIAETAKPFFKTPEQGCATTLWCATSAALDSRGGEYCEDCDIAQMMDDDSPRGMHVAPWAVDDEQAVRLWVETESMIKAA